MCAICSVVGSAMRAAQRVAVSGMLAGSTVLEKWAPMTSSGFQPVIRSIDSDMNVNMPSASVANTTSGEFSTRKR